MRKFAHTLLPGMLLAGTSILAANAQEPPPEQPAVRGPAIEEIVVTARKREESIQDVPVAVSAFAGDFLERNAVSDLSGLDTYTPNVHISSVSVNAGAAVTFIRGIGNRVQDPQVDSPIAVSIDGVYLSQISGGLLDLFDVQGVEVLRGPQGTLQGRNSPGGAINITTRRPSGETGGQAEIGFGRFGKRDMRVAAEAPLIDGLLAGRLSYGSSSFDGQVLNRNTGRKVGGSESDIVRASLLFTPTDALSIYATADYSSLTYEPAGLRYVGTEESFGPRQPAPLTCVMPDIALCTPYPRYTTDLDFDRDSKVELSGLALNADWDLGSVTLTGITGFRDVKDRQNVDVDGTSLPLLNANGRELDVTQISQELRLSSNGNEALDWVFGAYYLQSEHDLKEPLDVFGARVTTMQEQTLDSYAVFGHGIYHLTDRWSMSAGGRQTWDDKRASAVAAGFDESTRVHVENDWSNFSFEAGTEFRFTSDHLGYFRYAQGYRSGGIAQVSNPDDVFMFEPETVDSFEMGIKATWLDRRLQTNFAIFYSDYSDLQRDVVKPAANSGFTQTIENAASATIQGAELEITAALTDALTLRSAIGYLDAAYDEFPADLIGDGNVVDNRDLALPFTSEWTAWLAADYVLSVGQHGSLTLTPEVSYRSSFNANPLDIQVGAQDTFALFNVSATYTPASDRWGATVYLRNAFDEYYIEAGEPTGNITSWQVEGLRRHWGMRLFANF